MSSSPRGLAALLCFASLAACDGGTTQPPPLSLSVAVDGFLERSAIVHLRVTRQGAPVAPVEWQVTSEPAGAITVLGGDSVRLLRTGPVQLIVSVGSQRGTGTVQVARPPVVFFDRVVGGNRDIWRVDLDGQELTRLTSDPASDQDPTVGGGKVVFVSFRTGNADLWAVPVEGGANTQLTSAARNETTPAISGNGQRLAYAYDGGLVSKLWTASGDGSGAALATQGFGFNGSIESSPTWAPTGNRLVFMSTAAGSADIYDLTVGGPAPAPVAPSDSPEVEPAWSPDGLSVAFVSTRVAGNTDIYSVVLSTGAITRLTSGDFTEGQPAWTSDGKRLVFTEFTGGTRRLAWLEVARPGVVFAIPTGEGRAENAALAP